MRGQRLTAVFNILDLVWHRHGAPTLFLFESNLRLHFLAPGAFLLVGRCCMVSWPLNVGTRLGPPDAIISSPDASCSMVHGTFATTIVSVQRFLWH